MKLLTLEEFADDIKKINFIKYQPVYYPNKTKKFADLTDKVTETLFTVIGTTKKGKQGLNLDAPILYYGGTQPQSLKYLEQFVPDIKGMYNQPTDLTEKVKFAKLFGDKEYLPTSAYTLKEAEKLNFPVVAKPKKGLSGIGIQKFDTIEELKKAKGEFDIFSEYIDHVREYRAFFCKDRMILLDERVISETDPVSIDTKSKDEKMNFVYVHQDETKVPWMSKLLEIANELNSALKLGLYSVDFFLTEDDEIKVIEVNSGSGMGSEKLCLAYTAIYEDFYGEPVPVKVKKFMKKICDEFTRITWDLNPKEIKKSPYAINYESY